MTDLCLYCGQPIHYGIEMFGESPLHPECYDELQSDMAGDDHAPEAVLDLSWGGHPVEAALSGMSRSNGESDAIP